MSVDGAGIHLLLFWRQSSLNNTCWQELIADIKGWYLILLVRGVICPPSKNPTWWTLRLQSGWNWESWSIFDGPNLASIQLIMVCFWWPKWHILRAVNEFNYLTAWSLFLKGNSPVGKAFKAGEGVGSSICNEILLPPPQTKTQQKEIMGCFFQTNLSLCGKMTAKGCSPTPVQMCVFISDMVYDFKRQGRLGCMLIDWGSNTVERDCFPAPKQSKAQWFKNKRKWKDHYQTHVRIDHIWTVGGGADKAVEDQTHEREAMEAAARLAVVII